MCCRVEGGLDNAMGGLLNGVGEENLSQNDTYSSSPVKRAAFRGNLISLFKNVSWNVKTSFSSPWLKRLIKVAPKDNEQVRSAQCV